MTHKFKIGDHVTWNSEAGHVSGKIIKTHTKDVAYRGYPRASRKKLKKTSKFSYSTPKRGGLKEALRKNFGNTLDST